MLSILDQEQVKDVYYSQLLFNTVLKVFCQCNKARKWYKRYTDLNSESESPSVVSDSLWPHGLYNPWDSPGQNTGVGSLYLLQGIFPTQGLNPGVLHCRQFPYHLSHKRNSRILEWVACPFSSRSSRPRNQTGVSCIAGGLQQSLYVDDMIVYVEIPKECI